MSYNNIWEAVKRDIEKLRVVAALREGGELVGALREHKIVLMKDCQFVAGVTDEELLINPWKWLRLSKIEKLIVLIHEGAHVKLRHQERGKPFYKYGLSALEINIAADLAINSMLPYIADSVRPGVGMFQDWPLGLSFESYAYKILELKEQNKLIGDDVTGTIKSAMRCGELKDEMTPLEEKEVENTSVEDVMNDNAPHPGQNHHSDNSNSKSSSPISTRPDYGLGEPSPEFKSKLEKTIRDIESSLRKNGKIFDDRNQSRSCGNEVTQNAMIKYGVEKLRVQFLEKLFESVMSYSRPNRRTMEESIVLPKERKIGKNIVIGIDVSGSMNIDAVNKFVNLINRIAEDAEFWVCAFNAGLAGSMRCRGKIKTFFKPDGGTDFRVPFKFAEKKRCDTLLMLTDGECDIIPKKPKFRVIWCIYNNKKFVPPYGEVYFIE